MDSSSSISLASLKSKHSVNLLWISTEHCGRLEVPPCCKNWKYFLAKLACSTPWIASTISKAKLFEIPAKITYILCRDALLTQPFEILCKKHKTPFLKVWSILKYSKYLSSGNQFEILCMWVDTRIWGQESFWLRKFFKNDVKRINPSSSKVPRPNSSIIIMELGLK